MDTANLGPGELLSKPKVMPELLTNNETAAVCRVAPETLRYWRHVGKGPKSFKLNGRVLYALDDVAEWVAAARAEAP